MSTFLSLAIIVLLFVVFCTLFFISAISDAKVRDKSAEELLKALPSNIANKWIVRYNVGRPQGKFLKMKTFQGSGVLYVEDDEIKFEDIIGNENQIFELENSKISWVENKINGITNVFKIVDLDKAMFFYVDKGMPIVKTIDGNESTSELYSRLKTIKKAYKKAVKIKKAELEDEV